MKKTIISFAISTFLVIHGFADEIQLPHITVYGTATTEVVPDQMIWSVRVQNRGAVLETVASDHAKNLQGTLSLLKDLKVDEKTTQTSRMEFGENWEYRSSSRVKEGYIASTDISFKITNFELYSKLWFGLAKQSAVSVENVTYDHTKRIEFRNETRQKAITAAKEKAAAMAKSLGSQIGEPLLVEEDISVSDGWQWQGNLAANNLRTVSGEEQVGKGALSPGTIPVQARIKVAFRLVTTQK